MPKPCFSTAFIIFPPDPTVRGSRRTPPHTRTIRRTPAGIFPPHNIHAGTIIIYTRFNFRLSNGRLSRDRCRVGLRNGNTVYGERIDNRVPLTTIITARLPAVFRGPVGRIVSAGRQYNRSSVYKRRRGVLPRFLPTSVSSEPTKSG